MSRYLRKPNKQAEIELLRDASSLDGVAGGTAHPDLMDVDETEKKPTGELQITPRSSSAVPSCDYQQPSVCGFVPADRQ